MLLTLKLSMSISTGPGKFIIAFEVVIAEVEKVIFSWSLMGATIQDGSIITPFA